MPKNLEVYDTKKESQFSKSGEGFQEFEVLLIPRAAGNLTIPAIPVSYFDPKTAKYVSEATPSFQIKVLPGEGGGAAPGMNAPLTSTDNPAATEKLGKDIRYLKSQPSFDIPEKVKKIFWIVVFGILTFGFGIAFYKVYRFDPSDRGDAVRRRVREKMKAARVKLKAGDSRGVGVECGNAVLATLGEVTKAYSSKLQEQRFK